MMSTGQHQFSITDLSFAFKEYTPIWAHKPSSTFSSLLQLSSLLFSIFFSIIGNDCSVIVAQNQSSSTSSPGSSNGIQLTKQRVSTLATAVIADKVPALFKIPLVQQQQQQLYSHRNGCGDNFSAPSISSSYHQLMAN